MFDLLIFPLCLLQLISLIVVRPLATMVSLIRIFPILALQRISKTGFADSLPYQKFHLKLTEYLQNSADFCRKQFFLFNFAENSFKFRRNVAGSAKFVEVVSRNFWQKNGLFKNLAHAWYQCVSIKFEPITKVPKAGLYLL